MTVIFRPHCSECGYEFEVIHCDVANRPPFNAEFDPPCCPQCKARITNVLYFITDSDKMSFDYRKESADNYAKEIETKYET